MSGFGRILTGFLFVCCATQASFSAIYTVTKIADTNDGACNADCSLREAVAAANATPDDDVIQFAANPFSTPQTISLSGTEIAISFSGSLTINGPGANRLTLDGDGFRRLIAIHTATVYIDGLTFDGGGGIGATMSQRGGAILNFGGTTVITNSVFRNNATVSGGALANASSSLPGNLQGNLTLINCFIHDNLAANGIGGGILNFPDSTLIILNSTISRNSATDATPAGGGLEASGTVHISNSTFTRNTAGDGSGGGIHFNGTSLTLNNVTIANNGSVDGAAGLHRTAGTVYIRNTIIDDNNSGSASDDVVGTLISHGNNLIGTVGSSDGWVASDILNQPARLAPSATYGGMGWTSPLLTGSPAINAGNNCVVDLSCPVANPPAAIATDARGALRPTGAAVDIGAFESSAEYIAVLPNARPNSTYTHPIVNSTAFAYSITAGTLPPGLNLTVSQTIPGQASYSITGTPTQLGTFNFGITVTNGTNSALINYQIRVTATATVRGRVVSSDGRPVINAIVTLDDQIGTTYLARSNPFGFFTFVNVATGVTYNAVARAKGRQFAPQTVTVTDDVSNLNFIVTP